MSKSGIKPKPEHSLAEILQQLRQRALWIGGMAGSLWGVVTALLCFLAGVWLDLVLQLTPGLRIAVLLSAAAAGVLVFARQT
ncbi:MAG: hypothetical protein EXS05_15675 [Planctomycetaceae bacterium]|nr:hypothetical protein [Planctomycetaceae bacterium]